MGQNIRKRELRGKRTNRGYLIRAPTSGPSHSEKGTEREVKSKPRPGGWWGRTKQDRIGRAKECGSVKYEDRTDSSPTEHRPRHSGRRVTLHEYCKPARPGSRKHHSCSVYRCVSSSFGILVSSGISYGPTALKHSIQPSSKGSYPSPTPPRSGCSPAEAPPQTLVFPGASKLLKKAPQEGQRALPSHFLAAS